MTDKELADKELSKNNAFTLGYGNPKQPVKASMYSRESAQVNRILKIKTAKDKHDFLLKKCPLERRKALT